MKSIGVRITSTHVDATSDHMSLESVVEAKYYIKNGSKYIIYEEPEETGYGPGVMTTLKVQPEKVILLRHGQGATMRQVYAVGKEHGSIIATAFGDIDLRVRTHRLDIQVDRRGVGRIEIEYDVALFGEWSNKTLLLIDLWEGEQRWN